jgi:hypothetical protein
MSAAAPPLAPPAPPDGPSDPDRLQARREKEAVRALRARGVLVYPDVKHGHGVCIVDPYGVGWEDFRAVLRARPKPLFARLLRTYWPQEAGQLAAFTQGDAASVAGLIQRCLILRRAWDERVWLHGLLDRFVEACLDQADRYPELYVSLGLGPWTAGPHFPLNEEVATTLLADGASKERVLRVLRERTIRYHLGFTEEELSAHLHGAARILAASDEERPGVRLAVLARRSL